MHLTATAATGLGVASSMGSAYLFAQGDGGIATPTSILAAFIVIALSMSALQGWIIKRLFEELDKRTTENTARRELFDKLLAEEKGNSLARSKEDREFAKELIGDFKVEAEKDRLHTVREREQTAELADAERKQRFNEHNQVLLAIAGIKGAGAK